MLQKFCNKLGCNALIPATETYCETHRQPTDRHKLYDDFARDRQRKAFYQSGEWAAIRREVLKSYNHLDIYDYCVNGLITYADTVHHIVELSDDWSKRLAPGNLFPTSTANHNVIHALYSNDKVAAQMLLRSLLMCYQEEFR